MIFQRITGPATPEKVFIVVKNTYSTASLTNGQAAMWDYVTDIDGVGVTKPAAITVSGGLAAAGIVAETIAAGAYGLVQVYGLHTAALCRATTGGSITMTHGSPLALGLEASFALAPIVTSYASTALIKRYFPCAFAMARYTTRNVTGTAKAVFIKAL